MADMPVTAAAIAAAVASGEVKARDVLERHLAAIEAREGSVHAFNLVTTDAAREQADAVDAADAAHKLLEGLDEEDRALVLMKFAENHDYEALAEMFDSTPGALRMRISRIREKLAGKG